jgi:hypothetical protein
MLANPYIIANFAIPNRLIVQTESLAGKIRKIVFVCFRKVIYLCRPKLDESFRRRDELKK